MRLRPRTASPSGSDGPLLHTLVGHRAPIDAVAITPDGRIALSGDTDGVIKVWDLEQGCDRHTLKGHGSYITALAVTPDGRTALSGSYDRTVRVWNIELGDLLYTLEGHRVSVFSLAISLDGRRGASGCRKTMRVWDLEGGAQLGSVKHRGNGLDVTIDAEGIHAICQGKKGILRIALEDGSVEPPLKVKRARRYFQALSPDARLALTGHSYGTLTKWDVPSGCPVHEFTEHEASIQGIDLAPDGRHAATASADRTIRLWDLDADEERCVVEHPDQVRCVAITPDARLAVSGAQDCVVRAWDLTRAGTADGAAATTGRRVGRHRGGVSSLAISPDERLVATAGEDAVRIWNWARCEQVAVIDQPASRVAFAGPDRLLTAGWDEDPRIRVWTAPDGELVDVWEGHRKGVGALAADRIGAYAVSAAYDLTYRFWNAKTGEEIWRGQGHAGLSDEGTAAALTPDGRWALIGCWNGRARLIEVAGATEREVFDWHFLDRDALARRPDLSAFGESTRSLISDIAVDPSGSLAVSASADGTARLWELPTGRHRLTFDHRAPVRGVGISDDGHRIVTACEDLTVRAWNGVSGEMLAALTGDAQFTCCRISGDGLEVAAGDAGGQIHFLRLDDGG